MSGNNGFYLEEYKSLRQEIEAKLSGVLDFNRWGLIGLAVLYSYILSNPGKPILCLVPVCLSMAMIAHLNEEHRVVYLAATYIREQVEPWARDGGQIPTGWEMYLLLQRPKTPHWLLFWVRWPRATWDWAPVPLWLSLLVLTVAIALGVRCGWWLTPPVGCTT